MKLESLIQTMFWLSTEVTKVRRNLFNQEIISPSKKAKLPRSQSVSAVEGLKLKRKRSHESEGKVIGYFKFEPFTLSVKPSVLFSYEWVMEVFPFKSFFFPERHKLLTKKVCETPHHKQGSSRFLFRQKMGRYVQQQLTLLRLTDMLFTSHYTTCMSQKCEIWFPYWFLMNFQCVFFIIPRVSLKTTLKQSRKKTEMYSNWLITSGPSVLHSFPLWHQQATDLQYFFFFLNRCLKSP